jgi:hypothetical protein
MAPLFSTIVKLGARIANWLPLLCRGQCLRFGIFPIFPRRYSRSGAILNWRVQRLALFQILLVPLIQHIGRRPK